MYFVALFMSAMLYRIIPKKRQFFSFIGPYTMTVFLLHTFVKMAVANNKTQFDGLNPYVGIVLFVLLSAILTVLLGNKYVFAVYKWCIDLCKKIIFKKRMVINNEN